MATTMTAEDGAVVDDLVALGGLLDVTRLIVQKVLIPSVVLFGVGGNLVNVAVLTRRSMKSSTNSYLTALAVYDILYLVFALTMTLDHYSAVSRSPSYQHYRLPFGRPLTDTASNTGIWLTLTFTVERYIGVCHPMKGKVRYHVLPTACPVLAYLVHYFAGTDAKYCDQCYLHVCPLAYLNKKLSYRRGTAQRAMLVNSCLQFYEVLELERFKTAKVLFKVIQCH